MVTISNGELEVSISEKGAELQNLSYANIEYLWQAEAKSWGKHSPVLFPIVGELKNGMYIFKGREYKLARHGFARDKVFRVEHTSATSALFTLESDDQTLAVYPFEFLFKVGYRIEQNKLLCTYYVQNDTEHELYFSVGGHPAFNVPLSENLQYTDYALRFDNDDVLKRYLLQDGLIVGDTESIELNDKTLALKPELFHRDAIVLKHINSSEIKLKTNKDAHGLNFSFNDFPYFGIWAAKDAPFICLEPWCGVADSVDHDNQLVNKEGINKLAPGEEWQRTWSVEVF